MNAVATDEYDPFASDYHFLYSDRVLSGVPFLEGYAEVLHTLPPRARILDCACGIGIHSLALARRGYDVRGADASAGMIAEARRRAALAGLAVEFATCSWAELPKTFARHFDLVFCYGNAIGHCRTPEEMVASLCGMRAVLKPGGVLAIDSRNWAKVRRERVRFSPMPMRVRDGSRCLPLYVWNFPPRWQDPHLIEVVLLFQEEARTLHRSYPFTYFPFRYQDLVIRLRGAGFREVRSDFDDAKDTYTVIARTDNQSVKGKRAQRPRP
jgi:SAM-dependent methyltransferase